MQGKQLPGSQIKTDLMDRKKNPLPAAMTIVWAIGAMVSCTPPGERSGTGPLAFDTILITDSANLWFARATADFNEDGLQDIALIDNNGYGGALLILAGSREGHWRSLLVADRAPNGGVFSCGDMEVADVDGDGSPDILAPQNNGEWTDLPKAHTFYWYSYPQLKANYMCRVDNYIKEVCLVDFDRDGKTDLAGMSFDGEYIVLFRQVKPDRWEEVHLIALPGLHEGMATGDVTGDGFEDIAANGYLLVNPGRDMAREWVVSEIDSIWHNQEGGWSRNATKHLCVDMDGDGRDEVLISHSERSGYPVALYSPVDIENNLWDREILVDTLTAAHTLQVADFDLDGDLDVLTGVNKGRAWGLGLRAFPVYILLNEGPEGWEQFLLDEKGIYNGHIADFDGDGDTDIFKLLSHAEGRFELLVNQAIP